MQKFEFEDTKFINMFKNIKYKQIQRGDLLKILKQQIVPVDVLPIATSNKKNNKWDCYLNTKLIDDTIEKKQVEVNNSFYVEKILYNQELINEFNQKINCCISV